MAKAVHKGARRSEATYPDVLPAPPLPEGGSFSCTISPRPSRCLYSAAQASSPTMAIVPVAATECPETGELEFSPANANVGLLDKPFRKALRAWLLFLRSGLPAILHSHPRFSTSRMLLPLGVDPRKLAAATVTVIQCHARNVYTANAWELADAQGTVGKLSASSLEVPGSRSKFQRSVNF